MFCNFPSCREAHPFLSSAKNSECSTRLSILILRIRALFFLLVAKGFKAAELRHQARVLYLVKIVRKHDNRNYKGPLPLLVGSVNAVRKGDVVSGKDMQAALKLGKRLQDRQFLQKHGLAFLKPTPFEKPHNIRKEVKEIRERGICAIASFYLLKAVASQPVTSELELCDRVAAFRKGFPAESPGLQLLRRTIYYSNFRVEEESDAKLTPKARRQAKKCSLNILDQAQASFFGLQLAGHEKKIEEIDYKEDRFNNMEKREEKQRRFDRLPSGLYKMGFDSSKEGRHAMAYLKLPFGSYLFDCNYGLLKCSSAADFIQHLKSHYPLSCKKRRLTIQLHLNALNAPAA